MSMRRHSSKTEVLGTVTLVSNKGNERTITFKKAKFPTLQDGNMKIVDGSKYNVKCWSIASQATLELIKKSVEDYTDSYLEAVGHTLCLNCDSCKSNCYNYHSYHYSSVLLSRMSNFYHTFDKYFVPNMIVMLCNALEKSVKEDKKLFVRIHVDGEFFSVDYGRKWCKICKYFLGNSYIKFYTYTKAYHIIEELERNNEIPDNLVVNLSLFDGMNKGIANYVLNSPYNVFYASDTMNLLPSDATVLECRGFDCANCNICATKFSKKVIIHTPIH